MSKKKSKKKSKKDSNELAPPLNRSILDTKGVRVLITALAAAVVEQLLEAIAKPADDSKAGNQGLNKLGNLMQEAAVSL
jgi:hypothetical protein